MNSSQTNIGNISTASFVTGRKGKVLKSLSPVELCKWGLLSFIELKMILTHCQVSSDLWSNRVVTVVCASSASHQQAGRCLQSTRSLVDSGRVWETKFHIYFLFSVSFSEFQTPLPKETCSSFWTFYSYNLVDTEWVYYWLREEFKFTFTVLLMKPQCCNIYIWEISHGEIKFVPLILNLLTSLLSTETSQACIKQKYFQDSHQIFIFVLY